MPSREDGTERKTDSLTSMELKKKEGEGSAKLTTARTLELI